MRTLSLPFRCPKATRIGGSSTWSSNLNHPLASAHLRLKRVTNGSDGRKDAIRLPPNAASLSYLRFYLDYFLHCDNQVLHRGVISATGGEDRARKRRRRRRKEKGGEGEEAKKRRLSDAQVKLLETSFQDERKLGAGRKASLAGDLGLDPKQVAVWFQNRRARHKSKQVEDAFAVLKAAHDAVVLEKCHLEHQVLELKKKILEVEEETKRLTSGGMDGGSSGSNGGGEGGDGSPSSSFSAVSQRAFFEESELLYTPEYRSFNDYMLDWANCYGVWIN